MKKAIVDVQGRGGDTSDVAMIKYVKSLADSSSGIIYVYPYIPGPKRLSRRLAEASKGGVKSGVSKRIGSVAVQSRTGKSSNKKWAVRIEGNRLPVNRIFDSKEQAQQHAEQLLQKGRGKTINIFS